MLALLQCGRRRRRPRPRQQLRVYDDDYEESYVQRMLCYESSYARYVITAIFTIFTISSYGRHSNQHLTVRGPTADDSLEVCLPDVKLLISLVFKGVHVGSPLPPSSLKT